MPDQPAAQIALITCPDEDCARQIATALIEQRLAACVNILPHLTSVYRWQGQIEQDAEHLLLAKLPADAPRFEALRDTVQAMHPYELPEIVAVPITNALPDYLQWIIDATSAP